MLKIIHRVNTVAALKQIPPQYGVEVDIRADGNRLVLHHDPFLGGEDFVAYLKEYRQAFIVLNIKEVGIERRVIEMVEARGIKDYFLLDVEFPYIFQATRAGKQKIAVRYSEAEPIAQALALKDLVEWVWIDTNTKLPLDKKVVQELRGFKTCLVSPDRWGRAKDISDYKNKVKDLGFKLEAVMVGIEHVDKWN